MNNFWLSHDAEDNPLDAPVAEIVINETLFSDLSGESNERASEDLVGTQIGPYKLKELIGEGGFGLVFVAEQQEPVRRLVALKIIKPGMDSRDVIARFSAERQALAMMGHPNIAMVLGAGISENQRLYFVMELVRGIPITEFCDHQRLNLNGRVELFRDVCSAIQHAHQKGVIHRDIKPSNVMVTLHDGKPVVKVIDFGLAKAIGQQLTDQTIYTQFFSMMGTPLYMSPEQAEMSGLDIDTRSDIYSLGVLLYELLTGTTPFERDRLNSVGYDELRRIIREEEPAKPSNRVTTLGERLTTVSASRNLEPRRLTGMIAGDLDWIVLKSLEKDRNRRYESAAALSDDLKRFLDEEPVVARAPTATYRLKKYYKRNRLALLTASAIAIALVVGSGVSLWQATQAITERNEKEEALQDAIIAKNEATKAREEVEQFADRLQQANLKMASGQAYADSGQLPAAFEDFSSAIELQPKYYLVWIQRAKLYADSSCWEEAAADFEMAAKLGAPADEPSWWGAPQLFCLTNRQELYQSVTSSMLGNQRGNEAVTWNAARNALIGKGHEVSFEQLADDCEKKLEEGRRERNRPRHFGPPPHDGPPPREQNLGERFGPNGAPPNGGGPMDDRGFGRPPAGGPGGPGGGPPPHARIGGAPGGEEWVPRGAEMFITGWAQLRAGRFGEAIRLLTRVSEKDRGWPGRDSIHFPLAIAYHKFGNAEKAVREFDRGRQALDRWVDSLADRSAGEMPMPWFDFVETQVLYREASILIKGVVPPEDSRLKKLRFENLERLSRNPTP